MIRFSCTKCVRGLGAPLAMAGLVVRCPSCATVVRVPQAASTPTDEQPTEQTWGEVFADLSAREPVPLVGQGGEQKGLLPQLRKLGRTLTPDFVRRRRPSSRD